MILVKFIPDKFYKERFSYQLDLYLGKSDILDLRAGYYDKIYKVTKPYTTLKFLKNGKTVSHWAKAYRGKVLKAVSKKQHKLNGRVYGFRDRTFKVQEIKVIKNKTEIILQYSINLKTFYKTITSSKSFCIKHKRGTYSK